MVFVSAIAKEKLVDGTRVLAKSKAARLTPKNLLALECSKMCLKKRDIRLPFLTRRIFPKGGRKGTSSKSLRFLVSFKSKRYLGDR